MNLEMTLILTKPHAMHETINHHVLLISMCTSIFHSRDKNCYNNIVLMLGHADIYQ